MLSIVFLITAKESQKEKEKLAKELEAEKERLIKE
jgi:hypothetical protein